MSMAIDDLRSMLDERHVKWRTDTSVTNKVEWTIWKSPWFKEVWAKEVDGSISIFSCSMTPAQAIEATLGRGECRNKARRPQTFWCDQCDCATEGWADVGGTLINGFRYCPMCGKKVRA